MAWAGGKEPEVLGVPKDSGRRFPQKSLGAQSQKTGFRWGLFLEFLKDAPQIPP